MIVLHNLMLLGAIFWTEVENFDKVKDYLRHEYGLVPPLGNNVTEYYLVYENERLVQGPQKGVYRVNFQPAHNHGPYIGFRYYVSRLNPEIEREDPMKRVMLEVYDILKPVKVTNWAIEPINLEQILRP